MSQNLLTANEVCALIGTSIYTLDQWYKFKRLHPENEWAKKLPDIVRVEGSKNRFWNRNDLPLLMEFKNTIPHGRNGILGEVTQKYYKKKGNKSNAKKKSSRKAASAHDNDRTA